MSETLREGRERLKREKALEHLPVLVVSLCRRLPKNDTRREQALQFLVDNGLMPEVTRAEIWQYEEDGWELAYAQSPLKPGQTGQHTNGPASLWARKDGGEWQFIPSRRPKHRIVEFYQANGRWPTESDQL